MHGPILNKQTMQREIEGEIQTIRFFHDQVEQHQYQNERVKLGRTCHFGENLGNSEGRKP